MYMNHLIELFENGDKLQVIPTRVEEKFYPDKEIKAIVFDIYGTLLISSSGDIDQSASDGQYLEKAFAGAGLHLVSKNGEKDELLTGIFKHLEQVIKKHQDTRKTANVLYPEVDIRNVWKDVIGEGIRKGYFLKKDDFDLEKLIFIFEWLSNKVYPMPGMKRVIDELIAKKKPIGIISNAQFYTPVMMNYSLNNKIDVSENIDGFDPEISVFSYKQLRGKPDFELFHPVLKGLKDKYNCLPHQVLFVGNDMFKDVYPAFKTGFKTVLFAGDKRSLRLRRDKEEVKNLEPDFIITRLEQLFEIVNL